MGICLLCPKDVDSFINNGSNLNSKAPSYLQEANHGLSDYWIFWITSPSTRDSMLAQNIISLRNLKTAGFNMKYFSSI